MVNTLVVQLSRQELYDKIWSISVTGVAKEYSIPYAQLMKQVKEANIPIPPSGYWTKVSFGKPVEKIPLAGEGEDMVSLFTTERVLTLVREAVAVAAPIPTPASKATPVMPATEETTSQNESSSIEAPIEAVEPSEPVETYEQYGQTYNVYDRETLYREVWEKPVTEVAKRYRVSDVAIHKVCKSLDIPTPPQGYWAKLRAGKPVKKLPLPDSEKPSTKSGLRTNLEPQAQAVKETLQFLSPEDKSVVLSVALQIRIPDENARMHAKIIAHRKKIVEWHKESRKKDEYWNRRNKGEAPFLADSISENTLPRVCRIFDALIRAMEPLGCSLTDDLKFVVNGETVSISVSESKDKTNHVPTKEENIRLIKYEEEKRKYSWASKPNIRKYDHVYNGKLSIVVSGEKSFRDCKSYVIEDCLGDILILLYEASDTLRIQREARNEAERKRKEEERQREARRERYNLEVKRTISLVNESEDFAIACKIRAYISAVEQKENLTQEEIEWIAWAKRKADWYDPSVEYDDEFLGKRKHSQGAGQKELKESYSSWGW